MYGKVFESIYDGTLAGHWQAIVTMQQLIVLANEDGVVDMTLDALHRRTSIPVHILKAGLEHLAKPDPFTRTPGEDGRRIVPLEEHRPWGWRLVNYAKYRGLRNMEQKREADRVRIAEKREAEKLKQNRHVATPSQGVADVAHADTEVETDTEKSKGIVGLPPDASATGGQEKTRELRRQAIEVLGFLNEKTGRDYRPVPANVDMIVARLRDGATVADLRAVVAKKTREWQGDEKMAIYLRPATLFNRTKFAQYQGELVTA